MKNIFHQVEVFFNKALSLLHVQQNVGGLDVSDHVLRFAYYNGEQWRLQAFRLAPGVIKDGRIKNKDAFRIALLELKAEVFGAKSGKKKINVVVSLSSVNAYSQVFSLPLLSGDSLEKAVMLNIKMASPDDVAKMYTDWQVVGRDTAIGRCDVLSVFIDRPLVDELTEVLSSAGFVAMALESKALILARMLREKGASISHDQSYVVVSVDDVGIDFLIIRKGELYFEYVNLWRDLMDAKGQIQMDVFTAAIEQSIRQVMNFYGQHWPDSVSGVFIAATALYEETRSAVIANVSVPVASYTLYFKDQEISPNWLVAVGCGTRSINFGKRKKEISLLSVSAEETYLRDRFVNFMDFWRVLIPVIFSLIIVVLTGTDIFLARVQVTVAAESAAALKNGTIPGVATALDLASQFNQSVMFIQTIEKAADPKMPTVSAIADIASSSGITVTGISFPSGSGTITFTGTAESEDQIFSFEKTMQGDSRFTDVDVPLAGIQTPLGGGAFSFTMTLSRAK